MDELIDQPDIAKIKSTNTKLAVAVGVFGMSAFGLLYVLFFLAMIFKPGLLFSIIPFPSTADSVASDGSRAWLLSQKPDMRNFSPREHKPPKTKYYLSPLEGSSSGQETEVPAYDSVSGGGGKLVFLHEGGYRIFDGSDWKEWQTDSIGSDPRGALSPDGIYVISSFNNTSRLSFIRDGAATAIPLPQAFLEAEKKSPCPCAKIVWYDGSLRMFWPGDDAMTWTTWNGSVWAGPSVSQHYSGGFDVVADGQRLYFFNRQGEGAEKILRCYVYEKNEWTGPIDLPLVNGFSHWDAFVQQGSLKLLIRQAAHRTLYTFENGKLGNPISLASTFRPGRFLGGLAVMVLGGNAAVFAIIFGVSALINKYKSARWTERDVRYEFASLFRRFLAMFIDNLLLMLPPAFAVVVLFPFRNAARNPFGPVLFIFGMMLFVFVGGFLYHSFLEGLLGQTLGKKICGIRVLKTDFAPCGLSAGFLRSLMRIVDAFFYYLVAAVSLSATLKWQRLGDLVAETVVVREKKR